MISLLRHSRFTAILISAFVICATVAIAGGFFKPLSSKADFGSVTANGGNATQGLEFVNTSSDTAGINGFATLTKGSNDWRVSSDGCVGAVLPPNSGCNVEVTFAPTSLGTQRAVLSVTAVDLSNGHNSTANAHLQGTGI